MSNRTRSILSGFFVALMFLGAALMLIGLLGCSLGCAADVAASAYRGATVDNTRPTAEADFQYGVTVRVGVACIFDDGPRIIGGGSGVAVGPRHVLTAWHVVEGGLKRCPTIPIYGIEDGKGNLLGLGALGAAAPEADAAILELDDTRPSLKSWALPATAPPRLDERLCSLGGDRTLNMSMKKCGHVWRVTTTGLYVSIPAVPGNSGGPVFRGRELVGIVTAGAWDPTREKFMIASPAAAWVHLLPRRGRK